MNFFRKLERKFGRFAIPNLMYYIIMMYAAGFVMSLFNPYFYVQYLALDAAAILRGQVWRIVTFLVCPPTVGGHTRKVTILHTCPRRIAAASSARYCT